jgi:hypothetical protein
VVGGAQVSEVLQEVAAEMAHEAHGEARRQDAALQAKLTAQVLPAKAACVQTCCIRCLPSRHLPAAHDFISCALRSYLGGIVNDHWLAVTPQRCESWMRWRHI